MYKTEHIKIKYMVMLFGKCHSPRIGRVSHIDPWVPPLCQNTVTTLFVVRASRAKVSRMGRFGRLGPEHQRGAGWSPLGWLKGLTTSRERVFDAHRGCLP